MREKIRNRKRASNLELRVGAHWNINAVSLWQADANHIRAKRVLRQSASTGVKKGNFRPFLGSIPGLNGRRNQVSSGNALKASTSSTMFTAVSWSM